MRSRPSTRTPWACFAVPPFRYQRRAPKERFREVGRLLDDADDHVAKDAAAAAFGELIRDRNKWLVERLYEGTSGVLIRSFGP